MATVTPSDVIEGVYIVDPEIHGDERGYFVETYRRQWFPNGREMIQGNRGDRQAGAIVGLHYHLHQADYWYVPYGTARVVLHDLRQGSPTDGATLTIDLGRRERRHPLAPGRVHPAGPGPRLRRPHRHDHHLPGRQLLQPRRRAGRGLERPGGRGRLGHRRTDPVGPRPGQPAAGRPRAACGSRTSRCAPDRSSPRTRGLPAAAESTQPVEERHRRRAPSTIDGRPQRRRSRRSTAATQQADDRPPARG